MLGKVKKTKVDCLKTFQSSKYLQNASKGAMTSTLSSHLKSNLNASVFIKSTQTPRHSLCHCFSAFLCTLTLHQHAIIYLTERFLPSEELFTQDIFNTCTHSITAHSWHRAISSWYLTLCTYIMWLMARGKIQNIFYAKCVGQAYFKACSCWVDCNGVCHPEPWKLSDSYCS